VDFTDTGDVIGSVNILYSRPRVDALVHWLHGGAYPHREQILEEVQITGELLGPMHEFGHVAVSGVRRYRSGALDESWRDNFFAAHFNSGKVVRLEIARDGSTYRATQREFLTGISRDFHPTDIVEDADGSLLIIDTGGWFYRGCPTSQLAKPDVLGAIYRVRRKGMTTLPDPRGRRIDWQKLTDAQLVQLLNDTRFTVREQAIAACARRGQSIIARLAQAVQRADGRIRQDALWALTRLAAARDDSAESQAIAKAAHAAIRPALSDRTADIRQIACRSIATYPDPAAVEQLMKIVQFDEPPVRRQAAHALGVIGDARAVAALLEALARRGGIDRSEEHAIIYALIEINDAAAAAQGLAAEQPAGVRRGALIALDQMDAGKLTAADVVPLFDADNAALRQTALEVFRRRIKSNSAKERSRWVDRATWMLAHWLRSRIPTDREPIVSGLVTTLAAENQVAELVGTALDISVPKSETQKLFLEAVAASNNLPLHKSWVAPLERNLGSDDPQVLERAVAAVSAIASDRFAEPLRKLAADSARPTSIRLAAMQALARRGTRLSAEGFEFLTGLVESGGPNESARAAQMLGASSLTADQLRRLAPLLEAAGPLVLRDLIRPFQRSGDAAARVAFLDGIEKARSLLSLPTNEVSDIVKSYPAELRPRANALLARMRQHDEDQLARLDALLPLLEHGDPQRGREAFFSEKSKCATCHRVGDQGGKVGPDLSTIGANREARDLIESIVFPSASIVRQYEPYNLLTDSGRTYDGLIVRETADTLYVQQQTGEPVTVPRAEIVVRQPSAVSIMPKGLEQTLTEQQLADIVAWLLSLK
jgi:putative heme-binding domain-containing protein